MPVCPISRDVSLRQTVGEKSLWPSIPPQVGLRQGLARSMEGDPGTEQRPGGAMWDRLRDVCGLWTFLTGVAAQSPAFATVEILGRGLMQELCRAGDRRSAVSRPPALAPSGPCFPGERLSWAGTWGQRMASTEGVALSSVGLTPLSSGPVDGSYEGSQLAGGQAGSSQLKTQAGGRSG